MTFPTPWTVVILSVTSGGFDDYGNPVQTTTEADWPVYGWGPGGSEELTGWTSQVTSEVAVYGPQPPVEITPQSQVRIEGVTYDVDGVLQDFDHGPFGFAPGVRVGLTRTSG